MKCEDLQFNLSVYADDFLTPDERAAVEKHLEICPLCREKASDFQSLRVELRNLARPEIPSDLLVSMRSKVAEKAASNAGKEKTFFDENFLGWLQMRFMPYGVGTFASLLFGFLLLWNLLSAARVSPDLEIAGYNASTKSSILLAANNNLETNGDRIGAQTGDLTASALSISNESPSINPHGALVALTKSFVRGKMKDDEVVVVADVFGNGLAQIAEVVEPSKDIRAVHELEKALKENPEYAPFVPASLDRRAETVRVVFKIQSVNVNTNMKPANKRKNVSAKL